MSLGSLAQAHRLDSTLNLRHRHTLQERSFKWQRDEGTVSDGETKRSMEQDARYKQTRH
jgi:hypothetical protein